LRRGNHIQHTRPREKARAGHGLSASPRGPAARYRAVKPMSLPGTSDLPERPPYCERLDPVPDTIPRKIADRFGRRSECFLQDDDFRLLACSPCLRQPAGYLPKRIVTLGDRPGQRGDVIGHHGKIGMVGGYVARQDRTRHGHRLSNRRAAYYDPKSKTVPHAKWQEACPTTLSIRESKLFHRSRPLISRHERRAIPCSLRGNDRCGSVLLKRGKQGGQPVLSFIGLLSFDPLDELGAKAKLCGSRTSNKCGR
jgi:hypothetical protein